MKKNRKTIAKPSEIKELDMRPVSPIELKGKITNEDLHGWISEVNRKLFNLRRDYDHLHAVVESMYNKEDLEKPVKIG